MTPRSLALLVIKANFQVVSWAELEISDCLSVNIKVIETLAAIRSREVWSETDTIYLSDESVDSVRMDYSFHSRYFSISDPGFIDQIVGCLSEAMFLTR